MALDAVQGREASPRFLIRKLDPVEPKKHGMRLFGGFAGDELLTSYVGIIIKHEIRIPIKQLA